MACSLRKEEKNNWKTTPFDSVDLRKETKTGRHADGQSKRKRVTCRVFVSVDGSCRSKGFSIEAGWMEQLKWVFWRENNDST